MSDDESGEDDDWFERAVGGGESVVDADAAGDDAAAEAAARSEARGNDPDADSAASDAERPANSTVDETATDAEAGAATDGTDDAAAGRGGPARTAVDETTAESLEDQDPDGDELDAAFEAASAAASSGEEGQDPFAGDAADLDFGSGDGAEDGGSLFEDDFASAFGGGGDGEAFDEEDFDSDIPRIDVGIGGLDRMIRGGVPERHLMVAIGSAGTGKTTFALQYLNHGLENGERGVFITLEQSHDSIIDTAAEYGWDFEQYEAEDKLAVIDLDPVEMANSLDNIRGELATLVEEFGADRFVLDSVSLLEMMYDDQARRRTEVFDFTRSLKRAGVTTLLTSEADEDNPYASRHGIIEYLTDAVFILQYVRAETQETRLAVEIQKIRNANHSRETKPYEITDQGISVYEQANIF